MKQTQYEQILEYYKRHKYITPMDAFMHLGITKLATRVSEMIRMGFVFEKELINVMNRNGKTVQVMRYELMGKIEQGDFVNKKEVIRRLAA